MKFSRVSRNFTRCPETFNCLSSFFVPTQKNSELQKLSIKQCLISCEVLLTLVQLRPRDPSPGLLLIITTGYIRLRLPSRSTCPDLILVRLLVECHDQGHALKPFFWPDQIQDPWSYIYNCWNFFLKWTQCLRSNIRLKCFNYQASELPSRLSCLHPRETSAIHWSKVFWSFVWLEPSKANGLKCIQMMPPSDQTMLVTKGLPMSTVHHHKISRLLYLFFVYSLPTLFIRLCLSFWLLKFKKKMDWFAM